MRTGPSRRSFVQLAAGALALPFLPLTSRAQDSGGRPPLRILTICDHHGITGDRTATWARSETGDYELADDDLMLGLAPLARHKDKMVVIDGIVMKSRQVLGGSAAHFAVDAQALTGSRGAGGRAGIVHYHPSIDAFLGNFLNEDYGLTSPRIYPYVKLAGNFNYGMDGNPVQAPGSPLAVHQAIFGGSDTTGLSASRLVLEQVENQLRAIRPELIHANKSTVLDAYESSVQAVAREVELRRDLVCEPTVPNSWPAANSREGIETYFEQIFHMFACDLVSSVSLSFHHQQRYNWLIGDPVADAAGASLLNLNNHALSHRGTDPAGPTQAMCYRWRNEQLANLIDRLAATPEVDGSGSVMDNTVIFNTASMTKNTHKTDVSYPNFIIAGQNANLRGGWHIDAAGRSNNDLYTTVAQAVMSPTDKFGGFAADGTDRSDELNAGPIESVLKETV